MEAKDTVMGIVERKELFKKWENLPAKDAPNFDDYLFEAQAEISFKAGIKEAAERLERWQKLGTHLVSNEAIKKLKEAGGN